VRLGVFCAYRVEILQDNCHWEVAAIVCVLCRRIQVVLDFLFTGGRNSA